MLETFPVRLTAVQFKIVTEIMDRACIQLSEVLGDSPDNSHAEMKWEMLDDSCLWVEIQFFIDRHFRRPDLF